MSFGGFRGGNEGDFGPPPPPFRIHRRGWQMPSLGGYQRYVILGVALIFFFIFLDTAKGLYVNWLWFDGVGYRAVYTKMLTTQVSLFAGGALLFVLFYGGNVWLAASIALRSPARGLREDEAASLRRLWQVGLIASTLFLAVVFGSIAAGRWDTVLAFLEAQPFGQEDPQFHRDISFFVFDLPALRFFYGWLMGMSVLCVLSVAGLYFLHYLNNGVDAAAAARSRVQVSLLLLAIVALFIWRYWLQRFELDLSHNGVVFGATYADIHARLLMIYVSAAFGVITGLALLACVFGRGVSLPIGSAMIWALVAVVGSGIYPSTVQRLSVAPNELEKERPYIERNIAMTRQAFNLDDIEERPFPAAEAVTPAEIADNQQTIDNIRLLDVRPLLATYAQIQALRRLYEFRDVDVDRYQINGALRQVMLSARELSPDRLPAEAQSWVNRRLQFTHGYGVVMSPVNEVVQEGLPELLLRDIPVTGVLPVTRPEIYYGEEPEHYIVVKTRAKEFDYPIGDVSQQTVFEGEGGVKAGSLLRRLILAWHFGDLNIAISGSLTADSRVLFRRNIVERVHEIAPFLELDRDPYLVVADGQLFWIQDAYTTTDRYPYSQPSPQGYNYIRNSVKVVINAYDGSTDFYLSDPSDPIIQTYARIFPKLFKPIAQMPASLRPHVRYPEDLFLAQANQYRTYHIKDPGVLYNKEDIWRIPTEAFSGPEVQVMPYYVIMRIPGEATEEFALILPLTPSGNRDNTIAWIAARSDGANYGKLLAFRFPTDSSVYGPRQVESRIDQDPNISAQFSLWNQGGSRVIRGNLLMIPIGNGNLFVEPIYLQAETSQLPELKRVVVANGNRIAMEPSLAQSLAVIFGGAAPTPPGTTPGTSGTPPAAATPAATATPRPVTTPAPGGSTDVGELARQADAAYQRAQDALRAGDFASYGVEIARVESLIQQIVQLTGQR